MYMVTFRDIVVTKVSLNLWINSENFILFLTYIRHNNVCYVPIKLIKYCTQITIKYIR